MSELMTLSRSILQRKKAYEGATGDFTLLLNHIALAAKVVSRQVAKAGLLDVLGKAGKENVQGEEVQRLDVIANDLLIELLNDLPMVAAAVATLSSSSDADPGERGCGASCFNSTAITSGLNASNTSASLRHAAFSKHKRCSSAIASLASASCG